MRVFVVLALAWASGCSPNKTPPPDAATQPVAASTASETPSEPVAEAASPNPILPDSVNWPLEDAVAKLADEPTRLSAAVRLVQLSELDPFGDAAPLPAVIAERLRVVSLDESLWALGLRTMDANVLAAPVLIDSEGEASYPVEDLEPEFAFLHWSDDVEIFPHLLFSGDRVWMWSDGEWISALAVKQPAGLHFEKRAEKNRRSIVLLWRRPAASAPAEPSGEDAYAEVARYGWDPFEIAFAGPLCDKLPDSPNGQSGGQFELDLELSEALIPVGGLMPEPPKFEQRPNIPKENRPPPY